MTEMTEVSVELTINIKSVYHAPAEPNVGLFYPEILVEDIEIYDGDTQIKNVELEEYFLKNYQDNFIQALEEENDE